MNDNREVDEKERSKEEGSKEIGENKDNDNAKNEKDGKESMEVEKEVSLSIDNSAIAHVSVSRQSDELKGLGVCVYDQTEFETGVIKEIDKALQKQEEERRKCAEKVLLDELRSVQQRLNHIEKSLALVPANSEQMSREAKRQVEAIKREKEKKLKQLKILDAKMKALHCSSGDAVAIDIMAEDLERIDAMDDDDEQSLLRLKRLVTERENDHLIQTGQMTPFGTVAPSTGQLHNQRNRSVKIPAELTDFEKYLLKEAENQQSKKNVKLLVRRNAPSTVSISDISDKPSHSTDNSDFVSNTSEIERTGIKLNSINLQPFPKKTKKRRRKIKLGSRYAVGTRKKRKMFPSMNVHYRSDSEISDCENGDIAYDDLENDLSGSDEDYFPDQEEDKSDSDDNETVKAKRKIKEGVNESDTPWIEVAKEKEFIARNKAESRKFRFKRISDDGSYTTFMKRIKQYKRQCYVEKYEKPNEENNETDDEEDVEFEGGFRIPMKIWNKLYRYQQTGVRWLWELHQQNCGGIVGDEMGLGKTIQVIAFLAGLQHSKVHTHGDRFIGLGPVILVCPATVMHQWVKEFHLWFPMIRVVVLHVTGSFTGKKESLICNVNEERGVVITSYAGISIYQTLLLDYEWHYIILDEGHKIRNPDAKVTLACKQFRTCHRLILSGSPIQNNLKELWSLFDFVYPGKLGTLPVFMQQFAVPITHGGYSNASQVQVQTAYKCATVLRDTIKPYLLRRMKSDVKMTINLPEKNEQVLFCRLTEEQREVYKQYLSTAEAVNVINGTLQIFVGLIALRKICNHPDIFTGGPRIFKNTDINSLSDDMRYGYYKRSGKMMVVEVLLRLWQKQGHKVLLFTQSRQMLQILKGFVEENNYTYLSMDGTTSISSRQPLIAKFNNDPNIFLFLLTTRVGGLGVNLTGANRVIIYDPDWNPSTDTQARERAWRIGQDKQVTVYRLLTSGTIEEKIYHRQIFKQVLTNRILKDPRQRRFFKTNHLHELFTLGDAEEGTETSAIFAGTGSEVKLSPKSRKGHTPKSIPKKLVNQQNVSFSSEKINKMKELAKKLSLRLGHNSKSSTCSSISDPVDNSASDSCKRTLHDSKCSSTISDKVRKENDINIKMCDQDAVNKNLQSKNWKEKRRKKKGSIFEGEHVKYIVKQDVYQPSNTEEEAEQNMKQDEYVLQKLFKKNGICTALKHDAIMDSSDPDYLLVEGEAKRVAEEAVKALKRSRRQCMRAESGVPTWTGTHGISGAPPVARKRFGQKKRSVAPLIQNSEESIPSCSGYKRFKGTSTLPSSPASEASDSKSENTTITSSSDLLSRIKQRSQMVSTASNENRDDLELDETPTITPVTEHDELLVEMRNFIAFQAAVDGEATTKELLQEFKDKVPAKSSAVFKALLNQICTFRRLSDGGGVWQLKPEFS